MPIGERLADQLRRAWGGDPWHGPSVHDILSRLTARQAAHRRVRGSHTPWELVRHLTLWVEVPARRFDDPAVAATEDANFAAPVAFTEEQWQADVAALERAVHQFADRVQAMSDAALTAPVGDCGYSHEFMVDGVVQHFAYHAGQIALLARSEDTPPIVAPAPLIVLAAMLVAEAARYVFSLTLPAPSWAGIAIVLFGGWLLWWAHDHFVRARTPAVPWRASRVLVLGGPYRVTRNPMYIGMLIIQAGVGVARGNAWYLVMLIPAWMMLHWGVVLREERYLVRRFGAPYAELLRTSRRWLR
ncbi:MAG: DinB family protein [Gemmatimonadetes bacterium]|nr:DinB family protein [Gemmatimonadota bacterium]